MSANVGDTVTLQCFYEGNMAMHFSWYKQPLGEKPQVISTVYRYDEAPTFYHEFKGNPRYSVQSGQGINHLSISDINSLDSALYYCGSAHSNVLEFGKGTFLNIKGSNSKTVVEQPVSESVQPGDSVTLNCTIHMETCAGDHSVYWFRHGSGESHPGIIYTHGDRSDQCEKSPEAGSPTQSCVYNLIKRNLNLSDAGTYYCAVALCGEILFGKGTKLDIQGFLKAANHHKNSLRMSWMLTAVVVPLWWFTLVGFLPVEQSTTRMGSGCLGWGSPFQTRRLVAQAAMVTCKETHAAIIAVHKKGFTGKDIAASKIAPKSTIYLIIKNFKEISSFVVKKASGCIRKSSKSQDRLLRLIQLRIRGTTSTELAQI
ncbi:immunoglobulin alpha-2 heavy chain-like [Oncorhynchus nerka]|uniref:immunoglobulin alpha-2 heavy chain-like n=1 Tax=Oncorhynchus nerka TaxID=8023 RepID=UPI0031B857CF